MNAKNYIHKIKAAYANAKVKRDKLGVHVDSDWFILLFFFVVLTATATILSADAQRAINQSQAYESTNDTSLGKVSDFLDEKVLKDVLDFYDAKGAALNDIISNPQHVIDPSI